MGILSFGNFTKRGDPLRRTTAVVMRRAEVEEPMTICHDRCYLPQEEYDYMLRNCEVWVLEDLFYCFRLVSEMQQSSVLSSDDP